MLAQIRSAQSRNHASNLYSRLFQCDERAREIVKGQDVGVDLNLKWHELTEGKPVNSLSTDERMGIQNYFSGFIEGRLGWEPPRWWQTSLVELSTDDLLDFTDSGVGGILRQGYLEVAGSAALRLRGNEVVLAENDRAVAIPKHMLLAADEQHGVNRCSLKFTDDICIVAFYSDLPVGGEIIAIDLLSSTVLWHRAFWGTGTSRKFGGGGTWCTNVEIYTHGSVVIAAGAGTYGPYLEMFDSHTGSVKGRFCRNLWSHN